MHLSYIVKFELKSTASGGLYTENMTFENIYITQLNAKLSAKKANHLWYLVSHA